ncbi:MAG TPA: trypsin-like peptidase domain-containing protein, partial [Pyrinomonadaceae bacterium]|nr:trypsin-like peptidase domain-containing protein [Pyrinomonadaceae bacterium]
MAAGIIIHISIGGERRTEYFATEKIRIGSNSDSDIQITTKQIPVEGLWLELEDTEGVYRVTNFNPNLQFSVNGKPIRRYIAISDGDKIESAAGEMALSFFTLAGQGTLIKTGSSGRHVAQFIEEAALDAAASPRRDEAKAFLREFIRELSREISWTTKLMILVISVGFLTGILYLGYAVNEELKQSRQQAEQQNETIRRLESQLYEATNQLGSLEQTNKDLIRAQSLAQNVRVDYGTGVCLIMGVYDLVERKSGKVLRYADSSALNNPYEPAPEGSPSQPSGFLLTTEGTGSPVEYDFIGTGFHVGNGFIITNRHVLQPWSEDEIVKAMIRDYNGAPRVKWLVAYFPNHSEPYTLKVKGFAAREDIAVAAIETDNFPADIPSLPLDFGSDAATVGKTVVSIGYPSGLD